MQKYPCTCKPNHAIVGHVWDFAVNKGLIDSDKRSPTDTARALLAKYSQPT